MAHQTRHYTGLLPTVKVPPFRGLHEVPGSPRITGGGSVGTVFPSPKHLDTHPPGCYARRKHIPWRGLNISPSLFLPESPVGCSNWTAPRQGVEKRWSFVQTEFQ